MVRKLHNQEIDDLRRSATVARLASIDHSGFPHVVPLWFVWADGMFYMTSSHSRPHLRRIVANPRVGLVIDVEEPLRPDGERPNKQLRIIGTATVSPDSDNLWTTRIRHKYIDPHPGPPRNEPPRSIITVTPLQQTGVASI